MNIINYSKTTNEYYTIGLGEDIILNASLVDGKVTEYSFKVEAYTMFYPLHYVENIDPYIKTFWNEHYQLLKTEKKFTTLDELTTIDINNLYYIGASKDGMLRDNKGLPITTLIKCDDIFCKCFLKITSLLYSKTYKEQLEKSSYITNAEIVKIPYYNAEDGETHTIKFDMLLPDELYKRYLLNEKYLSEEIKKQIVWDIFNGVI